MTDSSDSASRRTVPDRKRVLLFLALMSSEEAQESCAERMDRGRLAFELCRVWIEEIFVPGWTRLDGIKGDRDVRAAARFWEAFDGEEREALERFHRFVELRVEMLPEEARRDRRFPQNDRWENLMRDAANTLEALEVEYEELRSGLAEVIRLLTGSDQGGTGESGEGSGWVAALTSGTGP